ncbi:hypothetical protein ACLOJK_033449 [Asimina triloba]
MWTGSNFFKRPNKCYEYDFTGLIDGSTRVRRRPSFGVEQIHVFLHGYAAPCNTEPTPAPRCWRHHPWAPGGGCEVEGGGVVEGMTVKKGQAKEFEEIEVVESTAGGGGEEGGESEAGEGIVEEGIGRVLGQFEKATMAVGAGEVGGGRWEGDGDDTGLGAVGGRDGGGGFWGEEDIFFFAVRVRVRMMTKERRGEREDRS